MSVTTADGVSATLVQPRIYRGSISPSVGSIGDLWEDTSGGTPSLKQCTNTSPLTWAAIGGGASDHGTLTGLLDDDHTQYQLRSEKGVAGGYASLDGSTTIPDVQIPSTIARDTEVSAAITTHEGAANPHPIYLTQAEGDAAYSSLGHTHNGLVPIGGATGEVLKKNSATNYDYSWQTDSTGGGGSATLVEIEVDLSATKAINSGSFTITSSGLTTGKMVSIQKSNGPYTGKGTLGDEAEMDSIQVTGKVINSTTIQCYWSSNTLVKGNHKFHYLVGA